MVDEIKWDCELYFINLHEGLIIMLLLDHGLDHVGPFGLFNYLMRTEGLIWWVSYSPMKSWVVVDLNQQINNGYGINTGITFGLLSWWLPYLILR